MHCKGFLFDQRLSSTPCCTPPSARQHPVMGTGRIAVLLISASVYVEAFIPVGSLPPQALASRRLMQREVNLMFARFAGG